MVLQKASNQCSKMFAMRWQLLWHMRNHNHLQSTGSSDRLKVFFKIKPLSSYNKKKQEHLVILAEISKILLDKKIDLGTRRVKASLPFAIHHNQAASLHY